MEHNENEVILGVKPVNKLMVTLGVPMVISMMLQAFYNIVDSAFVSNIPGTGEMSLNALTLAFPVQMLMVAIPLGTGVGMSAILSRTLGQGKKEKCAHIVGNALFLGVIIYIAFLLFGIFGAKAYIATQSENQQIVEYGSSYLSLCCCFSMGIIYFAVFEKALQATGLSLYSTIAQITGAVVNIILDPVLIYGLIGFPEMGVNGAAYATVIGQIASAVMGLIFHITKNREIKNGLKYCLPEGRTIKQIYSIGLPAITAQALMSVMTYCMNLILVRVDEALVTIYGLYYKIQQFVLFAAFGLRDAITPIVAFNYGKRDIKRICGGIKYGIMFTLIIMLAGLALIEIFAVPLTRVFSLSGDTETLCVSAMRLISISFIFAGLNIAYQGIYQALDSGIESLVISVCRQILFILPVAWLFSLIGLRDYGKAWLIWLTFPIGEFASSVIGTIFLLKIYKKKIQGI